MAKDEAGTVRGKRPTKRDQILRELRAMITSGDLPRGARVQQDDLAARFHTSITPVREALRQLEAEGLLVSSPHRGVRVSETNVEDQRGVYIARRRLESFAAQLATNRFSRRDIASAKELNEAMAEASRQEDAAQVTKANRDFHFLIYGRCEVPSLVSIIDGLWLSFPWDTLEVLDPTAARSVDEHTAIITAIEEGDIAAVGVAVEQHLRRSYHELVTHLTGSSTIEDPFDEFTDPC